MTKQLIFCIKNVDLELKIFNVNPVINPMHLANKSV